MKQLTFAVPNSVAEVLYEIENLGHTGTLNNLSCRLLEMFYVTGWDDGFVQFKRRDLCSTLGVSKTEINRAIDHLEASGLVNFRLADQHEVAEIVALCNPALSVTAQICWWQFYRVPLADSWLELSDDARSDS